MNLSGFARRTVHGALVPTKKSVCIEIVAFTGSPVTHCYRTKLGLAPLWPIPNADWCVIFCTDCSYIAPKSLALQERISSASWRIQPEGFFNFANPLTADVIQIEHRHGCAANGSPSFHFIAFRIGSAPTTVAGWDETRAPARLSPDQRPLSCRLYADCIRGMLRQGFPKRSGRPLIAG